MLAGRMRTAVGVGLALWLEAGFAHASGLPAEQAAEMLARAQSVDLKCSYLNGADKDALAQLVARAELALANRESVEATQAALQRGHASGAAVSCNASEKQAVTSILAAARQASTDHPSKTVSQFANTAPPVANDSSAMEALPAKPKASTMASVAPHENDAPAEPIAHSAIAMQEPVMPLVPKKPTTPKTKPVAQSQMQKLPKLKVVAQVKPKLPRVQSTGGGLNQYAQMTESYYVALRCRGGGSNVSGLYASIVAAHDNVMQSNGAAAVSTALHLAKARASSRSCL